MKKQALGKGLSALLAEMGGAQETPEAPARKEAAKPAGMHIVELSLDHIAPAKGQPRQEFDSIQLRELADSIAVKGVLQPILVRPAEAGKYEIIAGERRWRASRLAGRETIPALVRPLSDVDSFEAALIENVQRQDLNPVEEAAGYQRLIREFGHTQEMVASLTGKARSHIANLLRLLDLPDEVLELVKDGKLSVGHAKAVLSAVAPEALAREIVVRGLSVRQAERLARKGLAAPRLASHPAPDPDIAALEQQLTTSLGLPVKVENRGAVGKLTIAYKDLGELDRIISLLQV